MRTGVSDLPTPHPIRERLPAVYLDDEFTQRFTAALDEILAPVFATVDCFSGYLDPDLAPPDFVDWLAGWVALDLDDRWDYRQRREMLGHAVRMHRWRGTRRGLETQVRMLTGGEVEVTDSGGCVASEGANAPLPGGSPAWVRVRVRVRDPNTVDQRRLHAAVVQAVPAHVAATVEVLPIGESDRK